MTPDKTVLELANTLGIALTDIHAIYAEAIAGIAIIDLVGFAIFCIGMAITFKRTIGMIIERNKSSRFESDHKRNSLMKLDWDEDFPPVILIMVCTFVIIGLICAACTDVAQHYMYPEYFAIKEMLSIIGT